MYNLPHILKKCIKRGADTLENKERKPDRRVLKTKKAIRNAFSELLSKKDLNEITIKDIADTADINRKTFYNYYDGVYQIVNELEDEIVTALTDIIEYIDFSQGFTDSYDILVKLTEVINKDIDFYSHLMRVENNSKLVPKITAVLKEKIKISFSAQLQADTRTLDIITEYIFSGLLAVYKSWFNSDRKLAIEEISKTVSTLTVSGLNGILKEVI